jgi:hypothetical protein
VVLSDGFDLFGPLDAVVVALAEQMASKGSCNELPGRTWAHGPTRLVKPTRQTNPMTAPVDV